MTAYYALHTVGNLRAGEKVLIHRLGWRWAGSSAGGTAPWWEIFATAGVRRSGRFWKRWASYVFNSRALFC